MRAGPRFDWTASADQCKGSGINAKAPGRGVAKKVSAQNGELAQLYAGWHGNIRSDVIQRECLRVSGLSPLRMTSRHFSASLS